jgi:hypothetical protein
MLHRTYTFESTDLSLIERNKISATDFSYESDSISFVAMQSSVI